MVGVFYTLLFKYLNTTQKYKENIVSEQVWT